MVNIEAILLVNCCVVLNDRRHFAAILLNEVWCPVAHIAETLNRKRLVLDTSFWIAYLVRKTFGVQQLANGVVDSQTCWLSSSSNATVLNVFSRTAALKIDIRFTLDFLVLILDPCHHLLASSQIWTQTIHTSSNVAFLYQFIRISSCDSLKLPLRQFPRVYTNSSFGSSKRHICYSQFKCH